MRIAMVDGSGGGVGLVLGLRELGHTVHYTGPQPWPDAADDPALRRRRELLGDGAIAPDLAPTDVDLLVLVDAFADQLGVLAAGRFLDDPLAVDAPLRHHRNPRIVPHRRELYLRLANAARRVAVIDISDNPGPREQAFESLPHATLLAREVPIGDLGPWRPLPFLYNEVLLWIERRVDERDWLTPVGQRVQHLDWLFCGTLGPSRSGQRRTRLLAEVQQRWPQQRGGLASGISFVQVLAALQTARAGLDLPGLGELCFRVHECLFLGVPLLRPWPFAIAMPDGIERAFGATPTAAAAIDPATVREVYRRHYAPPIAAAALLAAVEAGAAPTLATTAG